VHGKKGDKTLEGKGLANAIFQTLGRGTPGQKGGAGSAIGKPPFRGDQTEKWGILKSKRVHPLSENIDQ